MRQYIMGVLLLVGIAVATHASAVDREFSGEASLGYGFKPEFVEADGDGKYALATGMVKMTTDRVWSLALEQALKSVEHPAKATSAEDPILRAAYLGNLMEGIGLKLSLRTSVLLGLSLASRDEDYYGALKPSATIAKTMGDGEVGVGIAATRHFRKYTRTPLGRSATVYGASGFVFGSYQWADLSARLSLSYTKSVPYEGVVKFGYVNEVGLGYGISEALSVEVDLSTSDLQQTADGSDVNEFSVYRQNKTEMYLGATYAL